MTVYVDFNQELALPDGQAAKYIKEHAHHEGTVHLGTRFMWDTLVDYLTYTCPDLIDEVRVIDKNGVHQMDGCGRFPDWLDPNTKNEDTYCDATYQLGSRYMDKVLDPNCLTCTHHCQNFMVMVNHKTGVA